MRKLHLGKENDEDLGFLVQAHGRAITWDEFQDWFLWLVQTYPADEVPYYATEIVMMNSQADYGAQAKRDWEFYGFTPGFSRNEGERFAIYGIGYVRGIPYIVNPPEGISIPPREVALKALEANPRVAEKFKELFPNLDLDWPIPT